MTSTVRSLTSRAVSVPLANPIRTASGEVTHAPLLLIDLMTSDGVVGYAYLFTYTPLVLAPLKSLVDSLGAVIAGVPAAPAVVLRTLDQRFRLLGNTGLVTMALAGIDMAVWDALARAAGLPLVRVLGGAPKPVPAYFSQGMDGLERGVELAHECLEHGFQLMKIKIGYQTLADDLAVIEAVQRTLGDRAGLAVDYNQSLTVPEAIRRCAALDHLGLAWIEEPTRQEDNAGHAHIAEATTTPIMIGENWFGVHEMARSIEARASDLVMPDLMKIGGVTAWQQAAALAAGARLPMGSHLFQEVTAHLMPVTPTASWLEYLDVAGPILEEPLKIERGMAILSAQPGSGVRWDEAAVTQFAA